MLAEPVAVELLDLFRVVKYDNRPTVGVARGY